MTAPPPAPCVAYGDHADQVANLHLPPGERGPWPCVVLLHGGFWRTGWDRTLMTPLAVDLARRGYAAWNVEYRRVGQEGGWPGTFEDVAAAIDHLVRVDEVDVSRVMTCGHSAGGHLALWLATRHRLPAGALGGRPRVHPISVVAQAGVCDLERAWRDNLGAGAVTDLLGGSPRDVSDRYATASPAARGPLGVPQLLVHGENDDIVPVSQSRDQAARDPRAELVEPPGADHFDVIDSTHEAWATVVERLPALLAADILEP